MINHLVCFNLKCPRINKLCKLSIHVATYFYKRIWVYFSAILMEVFKCQCKVPLDMWNVTHFYQRFLQSLRLSKNSMSASNKNGQWQDKIYTCMKLSIMKK